MARAAGNDPAPKADPLTGRAFDLQIVRPAATAKALKRKDFITW